MPASGKYPGVKQGGLIELGVKVVIFPLPVFVGVFVMASQTVLTTAVVLDGENDVNVSERYYKSTLAGKTYGIFYLGYLCLAPVQGVRLIQGW